MRSDSIALAILFVFLAAGCSMPIKTVRLDSRAEPVRGVRYTLKRPSYTPGIRPPANVESLVALSDFEEVHIHKTQPFANSVDAYKKKRGRLPSGYRSCTSESKDKWCKTVLQLACATTSGDYTIVVGQSLTQEAIYEVREIPLWRMPFHMLANSEIAIVMDDDGRLTSLTAGETDQTLEFVQAVAGLAVTAAGAAENTGGAVCHLLPVRSKAADNYFKHRERTTALEKGVDQALTELENDDPTAQLSAVEALEKLDAELTAAKKVSTSIPMHRDLYRVEYRPKEPAPPWWRPAPKEPEPAKPVLLNTGTDQKIVTITLEEK